MNIYFLCLDDYPTKGACSSLLQNVFSQTRLGDKYSIHIVTFKHEKEQNSDEIIDNVHIHRINNYAWYNIHFLKKTSIIFRTAVFFSKIVEKLVAVISHEKTYSKIQEAKLYKFLESEEKVSVVVAVAGYFSTCAAGRKFKEKNSNVKFVVYQVDPCSTNETLDVTEKGKRELFEQEIYNCADGIITTDLIIDEQRDKLDKDILKKFTPCGFPNIVIRQFSNDAPFEKKKGYIYCTFAGRAYAGRNFKYLLDVFSTLKENKIMLILVGIEKSEITQCPDNVICMGNKTLENTRHIMSCSDVLVNVGNAMKNQVPSKLFEYFSFGKPIINIYQNENCPTLFYTTRYPLALNLFQDYDEIEKGSIILRDFILVEYNKRVSNKIILENYQESTPQYFMDCLLKYID